MAKNKDAEVIKKLLDKNPALTNNENAIRIFNEYRELGLIPKKYKVKEHFLNAVSKIARNDSITAQKAADKMVKLQAFANRKNLGPAVIDFIKKKVKYEGIPLELDSKGKARFAKRRFHESPPAQLKAYIKKLEDTNQLPKGYFKEFENWAKEGWKDAAKRNKELFEKTGIRFERGHLNESATGGPNVPTNQRSEKALGKGGNRSKGAKPNFKTPDIPNELGIPETWTRAFYEYDLDRQNLSATGLQKGQTLKDSDIARIELGENSETVINDRKLKYYEESLLDETQSLPKSHNQIVEQQKGLRSRVYNGSNGSNGVKNGFKNGKQQILKVLKDVTHTSKLIPTPVKRTVFTAAALAPGTLGTVASAADVIERGKIYEESKNWLDGIQLGLSNASLFTGWSGIGEIVATPADLLNLGLDAARFPRSPIDTGSRQRYRHGNR